MSEPRRWHGKKPPERADVLEAIASRLRYERVAQEKENWPLTVDRLQAAYDVLMDAPPSAWDKVLK